MSKQKAGHPGINGTDFDKGAPFNNQKAENEPLSTTEKLNNKKRKKNQ